MNKQKQLHRRNTAEYQNELNEAFCPAVKIWQKLSKSSKQKLLKARKANNTWYPELIDAQQNRFHPEKSHLVADFGRNKSPVWTLAPHFAQREDAHLMSVASRPIKNVANQNHRHVRELVTQLLNNPDRHVISANTNPNIVHPDHVELRVRHLVNALEGKEGYKIKDHPEGFEIFAPRHSSNPESKDIATSWVYNTNTKSLKSKRIMAKSMGGGDYDTGTIKKDVSQHGRKHKGSRNLSKSSRITSTENQISLDCYQTRRQVSSFKSLNKSYSKAVESLEKDRGTLKFPKILPKDTRPEENVKQIPKNEPTHEMKHGLWDVQPAKEQFMQAALTGVPPSHRYYESEKVQQALQSGMVGAYIPKTKQAFAFNSDFAPKGHEAIHAIVGKVATHFNVADKDIYEHINTLIHPEDKQILSHTLKVNGYPSHTHHAEYVPWIHTILHNKNARTHFLNSLKTFHEGADETKQRQAVQRLGRTWNAIVKMSKELDKLP